MCTERARMTAEARSAAWRQIRFSISMNIVAIFTVTGVMALMTMAAVAALADLWQGFAPELSERTGLFWISDVAWVAWTICVLLAVIIPAVIEVSTLIARALTGEDGDFGGRSEIGRESKPGAAARGAQ